MVHGVRGLQCGALFEYWFRSPHWNATGIGSAAVRIQSDPEPDSESVGDPDSDPVVSGPVCGLDPCPVLLLPATQNLDDQSLFDLSQLCSARTVGWI